MHGSGIVCTNLFFAWPDDTPVFEDLSCTVGTGRTGLVAPNGAGKPAILGEHPSNPRSRDDKINCDACRGG